MSAYNEIIEEVAASITQIFRGEIYDYGATIDLQNGYAVRGKFDVSRSSYMRGPFESLRNSAVRQVIVQKAVQTGGSLIADIWVPYLIEHDAGELLWLFQDEDMAKKYSETRFGPLVQRQPSLRQFMPENRNDRQKTTIIFPHMSLIMGGANEGNVQTLSKRYVICDEVWLYKPGIVRQAKKRTEAFPYNSKVFVVSQAGTTGDDMDLEWQASNQNLWHWQCPHCTRFNPFQWSIKRNDGSYAGMTWTRNDVTCPNGRWNILEAAKTARLVCEHCGGEVDDRPALRRQLDRNGKYFPKNPNADPTIHGYHWPAWACPDISFGKLVAEYLKAKEQDELHGYKLPLQEFRQKVEAMPWDSNAVHEMVMLTSEPYNPQAEWPEEKFRFLTVDCQKDFKEFWYVVRSWAESGESRQLARGRAESWEEAANIQKQFGVRDNNVFVDCGYEQSKVATECVKHGGIAAGRWVSWIAVKGVRQEVFTHQTKAGSEKRPYSTLDWLNPSIGRGGTSKPCPFFSWSNLQVKDILRRHRDGDAAKFLSLPDDAPPGDQWSYTAQMNSEIREKQMDERGRKVNIWRPIGRRPNHYWDCEAMQVVAALIAQIIGSREIPVDG